MREPQTRKAHRLLTKRGAFLVFRETSVRCPQSRRGTALFRRVTSSCLRRRGDDAAPSKSELILILTLTVYDSQQTITRLPVKFKRSRQRAMNMTYHDEGNGRLCTSSANLVERFVARALCVSQFGGTRNCKGFQR